MDRSTETGNKAKARQFLDALKGAIERGAFAQEPTMTIAAAIGAYIQSGRENRFFAPMLHYFKETDANDLDQTAIDAAAAAIYPRASAATRNRQFYTPLLAALNHAGHKLEINRPEGKEGEQRWIWLTPEQFDRLATAAAAEDPEFSCLLVLLRYTGLRLSEALGLQCEAVNLAEATVFCGKTKNGRPRQVHLVPRVVAALANHPRGLDRQERLFRWHKGSELYLLATRFYGIAGVNPQGAPFHILRHTYGSEMTKVGADLVATGVWKSPTAARVYQHFVVTEEAKKADGLPGAGGIQQS